MYKKYKKYIKMALCSMCLVSGAQSMQDPNSANNQQKVIKSQDLQISVSDANVDSLTKLVNTQGSVIQDLRSSRDTWIYIITLAVAIGIVGMILGAIALGKEDKSTISTELPISDDTSILPIGMQMSVTTTAADTAVHLWATGLCYGNYRLLLDSGCIVGQKIVTSLYNLTKDCDFTPIYRIMELVLRPGNSSLISNNGTITRVTGCNEQNFLYNITTPDNPTPTIGGVNNYYCYPQVEDKNEPIGQCTFLVTNRTESIQPTGDQMQSIHKQENSNPTSVKQAFIKSGICHLNYENLKLSGCIKSEENITNKYAPFSEECNFYPTYDIAELDLIVGNASKTIDGIYRETWGCDTFNAIMYQFDENNNKASMIPTQPGNCYPRVYDGQLVGQCRNDFTNYLSSNPLRSHKGLQFTGFTTGSCSRVAKLLEDAGCIVSREDITDQFEDRLSKTCKDEEGNDRPHIYKIERVILKAGASDKVNEDNIHTSIEECSQAEGRASIVDRTNGKMTMESYIGIVCNVYESYNRQIINQCKPETADFLI